MSGKKIFAGLALSLTVGMAALPLTAYGATNIAGTSWKLAGFGKQTLKFDNKGRLGGNAGCNDYSAGYKLSKDKINIGMVRSTRKMCLSTMVMKQEKNYLDMLSKAKKVSLKQGKLMLLDNSGKVLATFRPAK